MGTLIASALHSQWTSDETTAQPDEHDTSTRDTPDTSDPGGAGRFNMSRRSISQSTGRQGGRRAVLDLREQDVGQLSKLAIEQALSRLDALDDRLAYLH